jgi:hypothetical protein
MNYEDMFVPREDDQDLYMENDTKILKSMSDFETNKHHHKIFKRIITKTGKKTLSIEYYSTGAIGTTITHAVSGQKQRGYFVGSVHEDLFFKVSLANGENGSEPMTLFYFSPEEYEKHQYVTISDDIKSRWREKYFKTTLLMKTKE